MRLSRIRTTYGTTTVEELKSKYGGSSFVLFCFVLVFIQFDCFVCFTFPDYIFVYYPFED
ncbi:hypothetical protein Hdeb2414_s0573g00918771 [Helianthus debilis subsp. tardiflorus]